MGMGEKDGVCLAVGVGGKGDTERRVRGKSGRSWQQKEGTERWSQERGSQAFSNHFGTLGRWGCPGGTKGLGCSLSVPDPCQARMVWQRGEQLLPSASFSPSAPSTQSCSPLKCPKCLDFF